MFSWLTDLSKDPVDVESIWLVVSSTGAGQWAALVSALAYSKSEFAFEFDSQLVSGCDSVLLRFRNNELHRMQTVPASVIARINRPNDLTAVQVLVDECDCGAADCETATCYTAGRFVRRAPVWRAAA